MSAPYSIDRGRREAIREHVAMLVFSAAVSGSFSLGAMVANDISPVALTTVRFLGAAVMLIALVSLTPGSGRDGRRGFTRDDLRSPWRYAVLAALYGGYFVFMFEGLKTAHPVAAGAVFTLTPLMATGFAGVLIGQRVRAPVVLALLVGGIGALWVIFRGDLSALIRFEIGAGEMIYFLGCILHALYAPMLRKLNRGESAMVTACMVTAAGFVLLAVYGWRPVLETDWAAVPTLVWVALAYLVTFATVLASSMLQFAAQRLPSSNVMAYTYLTPVWIIAWELALGHGGPGTGVLPGIALVLFALTLLLRQR